MKRIISLLLLVVAFTLNAHAQKFALVDMEYIMGNIPAYERANEQLNQVSKKWQAEVEAIDNESKTLYKNYQNEAVFLSDAQKKEREQAIVDKEKQASELKKKYFGPEGELYKKRPFKTKSTTWSKPSHNAAASNSSSTAAATLPASFLPVLPSIFLTKC